MFKSTAEILQTPWEDQHSSSKILPIIPDTVQWHSIRAMEIPDVEIWEQIYYQGGNIGIYAAWKPYGEYYMIVYNLYANSPYGQETFYGPTAASDVKEKANNLGIELKIEKIWVDELNAWMYDDYRLTPS